MNKGPLIILGMGIGGMIFFGLLANWVVDNNPRVKKNLAYRQQVNDDFPVERVSISRERNDYRLRVWVKGNHVEAEVPSASQLPASLAGLRRHFEANFETRPAPTRLEIDVVKQPLWGCRGKEQVLWQVGYDLAKERSAVKQAVAKAMGATVHHLEIEPGDVLIVKTQKPRKAPAPPKLAVVAAAMRDALGGGWERLEVWHGRTRSIFDGDGKLIEQVDTRRSAPRPARPLQKETPAKSETPAKTPAKTG